MNQAANQVINVFLSNRSLFQQKAGWEAKDWSHYPPEHMVGAKGVVLMVELDVS
jgi:hypothetical protein